MHILMELILSSLKHNQSQQFATTEEKAALDPGHLPQEGCSMRSFVNRVHKLTDGETMSVFVTEEIFD